MTTIRSQLTVPEVTREFLRHRRPSRVRFWARIVLVVGGRTLLGARSFVDADAAAFCWLTGGVLLATDPFVIRHACGREVHRHLNLTEPKQTAFDEHGLVSAAPYMRTEMRWAAVQRLTQDEHYARLFTKGTPLPVVLLSRAFSPDDLAAFLRCCGQAPENPPPFVAPRSTAASPAAGAIIQSPNP